MSRSAKRWAIAMLFCVVCGLLATLLVLHDASASPAESFTGRAMQALGMPVATYGAPSLSLRDAGLGEVTTTLTGDTLVAGFDAGDAILNQDKTVPVNLVNTGNAPLQLQLEQVSCQCFRHIKLNGFVMGLRDRGATLRPGESGLLEITLKSDPEETRVEDLPKEGRFGITFNTNLPSASKLRVEATCRLLPPAESKKAAQVK